MSISRRTSLMVRTAGVASAAAALALGVAGNAFACSITEFSPTISCDQQSGQGVITVVDQDSSGTKVDISVLQGGSTLATQSGVMGSKQGETFTFPVAWTQGATYTIHVVKSQGGQVGDKTVTAPNTACAAPTKSPTPSDSPTAAPTTAAPSTSPTAAPTTSAAAVADTSSPSPSGSTSLAETGGGSNTGMIAGIAGALVVVGGGGVFMLRRRTPATRH